MADKGMSAKEAALIAQARAEVQKSAAVRAEPASSRASAARPQGQVLQPPEPSEAASPVEAAIPAPPADAADRIALLMAAARAETERVRRRQKMLYVWAPFAFIAIIGTSTLLWIWNKV